MSAEAAEYLKHIRSIHFALVGTCFAIAAASTLSGSDDIDTALEDVRSIESVVHQWSEMPSWLDDAAHRHLQEDGLLPPTDLSEALQDLQIVHNPRNPHFHRLRGPWFSIRSAKTRQVELIRSSPYRGEVPPLESSVSAQRELLLRVPSTLAEFRSVWNQLDEPLPIIVPREFPTKELLALVNNEQLIPLPAADSADFGPGKFLSELVLAPYSEEVGKVLAAFELGEEYRGYGFQEIRNSATAPYYVYIIVPVATSVISHLDAQEALTSRFGVNWRPGKFGAVFRELSAITENFQDVPIATLVTILEGEKKRAGERFELFGTNLPSNDLLRLALPVLAIVQVYFFLHLRQFNDRGQPEFDFPWIALCRTKTAAATTIASAIVLPVAVVFGFGIKEASRGGVPLGWVSALLVAVISGGAAIGSVRELTRLWNAPDPDIGHPD